jgi:hypothetical protein
MLPSVEDLRSYNNPHILERYSKDYPNNKLTAKETFEELKKYFWLCQKHKADTALSPNKDELQFKCAMYLEMKEIDDMWHTFLLFTQDYMRFCKKYFSQYLHHIPTPANKELQLREDFEKGFTLYLSYIYDHLGEETVKKWFSTLVTD